MAKSKRNLTAAIIYVALLIITLILVLKFGGTPKEERPKVGFITSENIENTGWTAMNYRGIQAACEAQQVDLIVRSEVPELEGACPRVVDELVSAGAKMIVLNSFGYSQEMKELLSNYPDVAFYNAASDYEAPNLTTYSPRMYQVRYLSGIVAGLQTKTGRIGFVAASQQTEVIRGINAFALGVRRVNPAAQVVVVWTNSWNDGDREKEAARELIENEGVDVITYHQSQAYVVRAADEAGIFSIGYYEALEDASDYCLTNAVCDWKPLYESLIREYLRGQGNRVSFDWLGLESNVVRLTDYSPLVPQETRDEVEKATQEILSGKDVFTGTIYDNEGKQRCGPGEAITDDTLMWHMDWLAEGVLVYEN